MGILNEKGELPRGFEILLRQLLKILNLDPEVTLAQISGIHDLLKRHVEQQDEILARLKRIEDGNENDMADGKFRGQHADAG